MTKDEVVGWHHQLKGHEFEQTSGDGVEQGILVCCSSWDGKELDTTYRLNNNHHTLMRDDETASERERDLPKGIPLGQLSPRGAQAGGEVTEVTNRHNIIHVGSHIDDSTT